MTIVKPVPHVVALLLLAGCATPATTGGIAEPVRLRAGDAFVDVGPQIAHAGPALFDLDGDGRRDLVVGTFLGVIAVYRDGGRSGEPQLEPRDFLQAEGEQVRINNW